MYSGGLRRGVFHLIAKQIKKDDDKPDKERPKIDWGTGEAVTRKRCDCSINRLMTVGCQCGGW